MNSLSNYWQLPIFFTDKKVDEMVFHILEMTKEKSDDYEYDLSTQIYKCIIHIVKPYLQQINIEITREKYWFVSPIQYIITHKIKISCKMLLETSTPLNEIAYSLGFFDQSHFTKTFKKMCGINPLKYRNSHKTK